MRWYPHWENPFSVSLTWYRQALFPCWLQARGCCSPRGPPECLLAVAAGYSQSDLREREPKMETAVFYKAISEVTYCAIIILLPAVGHTDQPCCPVRGLHRAWTPGGGDPWGPSWKLRTSLRQRCSLNS